MSQKEEESFLPEFEGSVFGLFGDSVVPVGEVLAGEPPVSEEISVYYKLNRGLDYV